MRVILVIFLGVLAVTTGGHAAQEKPWNLRASVAGGFDDNTGLDAERKGDWLTQQGVAASTKTPISKTASLRLSYDLLNNNYFEATDHNFLYQDAGAGFDIKLTPTTLLENDYDFLYLYFPNNESVTSYTHKARTGIKQKLAKNLIALAGVSAAEKKFDERKLRQATSVLSSSEELKDLRLSADGGFRIKLNEKVLSQFNFIYDLNDSNDAFHDYYDYDNYRFTSMTLVQWTKKLRSTFRLSYDFRDYKSRGLLFDPRRLEEDHVYTVSTAWHYRIAPAWTLGAVYSYRQKDSNEPSQEYSGSVTTLGLYSSF